MDLAENIKIHRKMKNLTQQELADLAGVSVMTMRRWEWGERIPRADEMAKLAAALGTTVGALMGENEPEAAPPETPQRNLPINSAPENKISNDDWDLSYWGGVVERAKRLARYEDNGEKKLIAGMLKMAVDAITNSEANLPAEKTQVGVLQKISGGIGNKNEYNA